MVRAEGTEREVTEARTSCSRHGKHTATWDGQELRMPQRDQKSSRLRRDSKSLGTSGKKVSDQVSSTLSTPPLIEWSSGSA